MKNKSTTILYAPVNDSCSIYLFGLFGEPEVESLYVFSFGGLALFLELMELRVQSFELVLERGCSREAMEFAHGQDLIQPPCGLGCAKLLGVTGVLMGERTGLLSATSCCFEFKPAAFQLYAFYGSTDQVCFYLCSIVLSLSMLCLPL